MSLLRSSALEYSWWPYSALFFLPDISLLALMAGKKPGAAAYNLLHHWLLGVVLYQLGSLLAIPALALVGVVLLGHASFDRMLGFPLMDASAPAVSPVS